MRAITIKKLLNITNLIRGMGVIGLIFSFVLILLWTASLMFNFMNPSFLSVLGILWILVMSLFFLSCPERE